MVIKQRDNLALRRVPRPAPVVGTVSALALCAAIPLVVISATATATPYPSWPLALVATIIAGSRFSWIVAAAKRRLFEMTTWLFLYLFMGLAPLVQLRQQRDPTTTSDLPHQFDGQAFAIVIASEVALIVGSSLGARGKASAPASARRVVSPSRTRNVALLLLMVGVLYVAQVGNGLFSSRWQRNGALINVIGDDALRTLFVGFATMGLLVAVVAQLEVWRSRRDEGEPKPVLLLGATMILLLLIVNPFGSPRFVLMTVILGLLAALGLYRNIRTYRAIALSAIAAMLILFPILDSFRVSVGEIQSVDPLGALITGDFDAYGQLLNTVNFVETHGITWGNQALGVLLFWVPRAIWPSKPVDTGILLAEDRGYWFTNLSAPLPAELFINGGWIALMVGTLIIGFFMRRWDDRNESTLQMTGVPSILGCVVPFYLVLLLRGSLLQATSNLAVILIVWLLVTRRADAQAAHPGTAEYERRARGASGLNRAMVQSRGKGSSRE